jgi:hypothetical protein
MHSGQFCVKSQLVLRTRDTVGKLIHREQSEFMGEMSGALELIPAASRLVGSLRDMGYEFPTAVADLVDNSIEAQATMVTIDIEFEGKNSWVRISDNGCGMTPSALREAMRYGSSRKYSANDLGKFGLGLKVASMSQCRRLTVASRRSRDRADVAAYCWDLEHIQRTNRWELIPVTSDYKGPSLLSPLRNGTGTVVLWQCLDRLLGYEIPNGESARRRLDSMSRELEGHLAVVFHQFLAGEVAGRSPLKILLNGTPIEPWDPFARNEPATKLLDPVRIPILHGGIKGQLTLQPFVLPHQDDFSSTQSFRRASGPANWNQQQGFYIYRANRLIQCGGWCRIRTLDEHTKLARVALHFSPQLDDAFRVNVAKMRVQLPPALREQISEAISPVTKLANLQYRRSVTRQISPASGSARSSEPREQLPGRVGDFKNAIDSLMSVANGQERRVIRRVALRLAKKAH